MFFLKKIFQLRDKANPHAEKPFLEHLEDLRVCITRVVLTLLIATVACFVFRNELMAIIRQPIKEVWERGEQKALKDTGIDLEDWEESKKRADAFTGLLPEDQDGYLQRFDNPEKVHAGIRAVTLYRAARTFEEEEAQREYIESLPSVEAAMKEKVLALIDGRPNSSSDARGKLVQMQALKPTEGFMLSIKLAFFAGIVVSFPFLLFFILQFVVPGMHDTERRALWPAMVVGFGLFLSGVFFSYFIVLPKVLEFFHTYSAGMMIENEWRIGYYISFATQFTLIFGLSFELPVLVMTLVHLGILNSEMMRTTRAYAILAIFVVAAIITPTPDAFTICLLAGPMVILYEICIWLAYFLDKKKAKQEAEEEKERLARLLALKERRAELGEEDEDDHGDDGEHGPGDHPPGPDDGPDHPHGHDHRGEHDHEPDDYHHGEHDHGHDPEFHEEIDPALTEDGEQEDVSDPWPEEEEDKSDDSETDEQSEDEPEDHDETEDDIPEEERHRERDDPDKQDRD